MLNRIASLANRHSALEVEIDQATERYTSDDIEVMRLKMEKLRVEDELRAISRISSAHSWDRWPFAAHNLIRS